MSSADVVRPVTLPPLTLPTVSFGPFRLLEAVPWLMFATAVRFVSFGKPVIMIPALALESVAVFLAFLLAARRMIEFADGRTDLGKLSFTQQLKLSRKVLGYVVLLLISATLIVALAVGRDAAPHMMLGFDGIAFDQFTRTGMVWSAILAAIVLLMVIRVGTDQEITLRAVFRELLQRAWWLVPGIVLVALMQVGLNAVQAVARNAVYVYWQTSPAPQTMKNFVYFVFVFGFASLRLWATLAILTFALRESYRRSNS